MIRAQPVAIAVYLEAGKKRVFAGALDWPGWCRSARDNASALDALVEYAPRYAAAVGRARRRFKPPRGTSDFDIVERLKGNATTDFGIPAIAPSADKHPLDDAELNRWLALFRACWAAFDEAADSAQSAVLRTGPRGGGRKLGAIRSHVFEADGAYLSKLGSKLRPQRGGKGSKTMDDLRAAIADAVTARARDKAPGRGPRGGALWWPRYAVRRSAWHALDHAWEIEDRAT